MTPEFSLYSEEGAPAIMGAKGKASLPPGIYKITIERAGKLASQYRERFGHEFAISLQGEGEFIASNSDKSSGRPSILLGLWVDKDGLHRTEEAYSRLYSAMTAFDGVEEWSFVEIFEAGDKKRAFDEH